MSKKSLKKMRGGADLSYETGTKELSPRKPPLRMLADDKVLSEPNDPSDYIKKDDTIYYDRHAGSTVEIDDNEYKVIKIQDVVIVL